MSIKIFGWTQRSLKTGDINSCIPLDLRDGVTMEARLPLNKQDEN
jgi:hypothetical protein